jgi:hypothetical protein
MTFQIRHDGRTFTVTTEVGDGETKVRFTEDNPPPEPPLEPGEEA